MPRTNGATYSNLAFYPERKLLVEPNRYRRSLLEKLEDEMNRGKQRLSRGGRVISSAGHCEWLDRQNPVSKEKENASEDRVEEIAQAGFYSAWSRALSVIDIER